MKKLTKQDWEFAAQMLALHLVSESDVRGAAYFLWLYRDRPAVLTALRWGLRVGNSGGRRAGEVEEYLKAHRSEWEEAERASTAKVTA